MTILIPSAQLFSDYLGKTNSAAPHRLPLTLSYSRN